MVAKASRADQDLRMFHETIHWPMWPLLPLKRSHKQPDLGVLWDSGPQFTPSPTVYLVNLFDVTSTEQMRSAEKIEYNSFQDMIADGWYVD